MKTAEEWCARQVHDPEKDAVIWVQQIQLDAMNEGMQRAAEIATKREAHGGVSEWDDADSKTSSMIRFAILAAAGKLTLP